MTTPRATTASSIQERPTATGVPRFNVRFRDAGVPRTVSFPTRPAAERWQRQLAKVGPADALALLDADPPDPPAPLIATAPVIVAPSTGGLTVSGWLARYMAEKTGLTQGTRKRDAAIARDIHPVLGDVVLAELTRADIATWVNGMAADGAAEKTMKNKVGYLSAAMKAAVKSDLIGRNPCDDVRPAKTPPLPKCALTKAEFDLLLCYVPDYWTPFVTFLVRTGLRFGEATALRVGDVNVDQETVTVTHAWKYTAGQGHELGVPKSKASRRTLKIGAALLDELAPLLAGRPRDAFLFVNTQGNPVRSATFSDNVWLPSVRLANGQHATSVKRIARRCDALGFDILPAPVGARLGRSPRPHDLRHTYATWLLLAGVPITVVSAMLGHEDIRTTVNTYGHVNTGAQLAGATAMDAIFAARPNLTLVQGRA